MNILSKSIIGSVIMLSITLGMAEANAKNKKNTKSYRYAPCESYPKHILDKKASKYGKSISKSASDYQVSENLIKAVITVESCFRQRARSPKGAAGLMQLMPATARRFGTSRKKRYNSKYNIRAGTRYLKFLLKRYQGNLALTAAAYNAGEGAVARHNGIPPYQETQKYVRKVLHVYKKLAGYKPARRGTIAGKRMNHRYQVQKRPIQRSRAWYISQFNHRKNLQRIKNLRLKRRITKRSSGLTRAELRLVKDLLH